MAFLVVFNPAIFMRSLGGDPDSDAMVMLIQLIAMALFMFSYKAAHESDEKRLISTRAAVFSVLAGLAMTAFALTWVGYWYMFYLITGVVLATIAVDAARRGSFGPMAIWKASKGMLISYALMAVIFFAASSAFHGPGFTWATIREPFASLQMKVESGDFPNVYVSVQEMMAGGTVSEIIQRAGTIFFFLTFILCIPYLIGSYISKRKHADTMILILLWAMGALFATLTAVRFSILLAIPISLGSAIVLAKIWRMALGEDKGLFE
jgi:asparagine N-glycosylation enzyme membrane subunit Stt3